MQLTVNTMKQASHYLLLCVLVMIGLSSCHKDIEEVGETTTTPVTQVDLMNLTQADVVGYIYDESDTPMADVDVSILGNSTRTNEFGVFVFRNTDLDASGTYITATKSGYILGSDRIYPDKADVNHSYIKMMRLTSTTTVNGANGGNVVVQGGGIITFGANTITNSDGVLYAGIVTVTAKRIAADDPDLADLMPGGLLAEDKEGFTRVLGTLGMVAVELRDDNGNELNLADGAEATIQFPIVQSQLSEAPDQIALWSFDEAKGIWIEEGFATRQGNNYIGQVQHFSFWNCDAPFPLIHVCGTILNADGTPAENISIEVVADVLYPTGYGITDSEGRFCGKMPKGKELTITIYYPGCEQEGYTYTVGPFDSDTELDPVSLANVNNGLITGTVFCDGIPVPNASVVVNINEETLIYLADENGNYNFNTSIFGCEAIEGGSIFAFNNETNEASASEQFEVFADASINLNTCGGCEMTLATSIGTDDVCDIESYYASVDVVGANGTVIYSWDNGSAEVVNTNIIVGFNCVTVTDSDGCQEVSCIEFEFIGIVDSLLVDNSSCEMNNGSIQSNPYGGTPPYLYEVTGPGGLISTQPVVEDLVPGTYTVNVVDANGCSVLTTAIIEEVGGIPEFEFFEECGYTQLFISPNLGDFNINFNGVEYTNFVEIFESGFYCFDITNSQGCMETRCIDVFVQEVLPITVNITCNYPYFNVDWGVEAFSAYYYSNQNPETLTELANPTSFDVNPLEYGYTGTLVIDQDFQMCQYEEFITLPNFSGLEATGISPSCDVCEDGYIEVVIDPDADCFECVAGSQVTIYDIENDELLENDLSETNTDQLMTSGSYYVIITDQDTGCIIAHKIIEL